MAKLKMSGLIIAFGPMQPTTFPFAMNGVYMEEDLIDAGIDPDVDQINAYIKVRDTGAKGPPTPYQSIYRGVELAAALKRRLDRGGPADLDRILVSVYGWHADLAALTADIKTSLPPGKTLTQVMQGK
jgi:hypothetical protein